MKISCEIIKDLLPLYHDDVCSKESRALVEEHLADCITCKNELSKFSKEFECPNLKTDEAMPIRAISNIWKRGKMRAFLKGTIITLIISALLFVGFLGLTQWRIIPVPSELIEVSNVCQLSDGRIVYHLNVADDRDLHYIKYTVDNGIFYQTPYRAVFESKRTMENGLYNNYYPIDVSKDTAFQQTYKDGFEITEVYIGPKNNGILIWKKGMELPPASEELEEIFVQNK
jgi:hypothetical protein